MATSLESGSAASAQGAQYTRSHALDEGRLRFAPRPAIQRSEQELQLTDLRSIQRPAIAARAAIAVVLCALLGACGSDSAGHKPAMTAYETAQHDRCVALLRPMLHGQPVRSTAVEHGAQGLDYVWVNAEVHDDEDDLDRRVAKGAHYGGHCQFEAGGQGVHLHVYALDADDSSTAGPPDYRFVADARDVVVSAGRH